MIFTDGDYFGISSPKRHPHWPACFAVCRIRVDRHPDGHHRANLACLHLAMVSRRLASRIFLYRAIYRVALRRLDCDRLDFVARLPTTFGSRLRSYWRWVGFAERADARAGFDRYGPVRCGLRNGNATHESFRRGGRTRAQRRSGEPAEFCVGHRRGGLFAAGAAGFAASAAVAPPSRGPRRPPASFPPLPLLAFSTLA